MPAHHPALRASPLRRPVPIRGAEKIQCFALLAALGVAFLLPAPASQATGGAAAATPQTGAPQVGPELIWDTRARRALSRAELDALLVRSPYVLLGEVHDNREQHRRQRDLLAAMVAAGRRPALVMEQFDSEHQPALNAIQQRPGVSAESLRAAGHWSPGWSWPDYAPLVALALDHRLPIRAGNVSRERAKPVTRQGFAAIPKEERQLLALETGWSPSQEQAQRQEVADGHCGQLDSEAGRQQAGRLAAVQRWRDGMLADALLDSPADEGGAVAILGNGHARRDLGVPTRIVARGLPATAVLAVGQIEWRDGANALADYPEARPERYDVVWFSPREERSDPCAAFVMPRPATNDGAKR